MKFKEIILRILALLLCPLIGLIFFAKFQFWLSSTFNIYIFFGGDKAAILFGLFIGLPLGSIFGLLLVDRIFNKVEKWNIKGIILAFILSILGNYFGLIMADEFGGEAIILVPLIVILLCNLGYYIGARYKSKKRGV